MKCKGNPIKDRSRRELINIRKGNIIRETGEKPTNKRKKKWKDKRNI